MEVPILVLMLAPISGAAHINFLESEVLMLEMSELVARAVELAREGRYAEAMAFFERDSAFTRVPLALSYYARCLAGTGGLFERAVALGLIASEREFYNPDIYCNLGSIFLMSNQKSAAIKTFRKGLKFDGKHEGCISALVKLGARRKPVFSFLSRKNAVNRFLGMLAGKFRVHIHA